MRWVGCVCVCGGGVGVWGKGKIKTGQGRRGSRTSPGTKIQLTV